MEGLGVIGSRLRTMLVMPRRFGGSSGAGESVR